MYHPGFYVPPVQKKRSLLEELSEKEKLLVEVLRGQLVPEIKEDLSEALKRDPSSDEIENIFESTIEQMIKNGGFKKMMDEYYQAELNDQLAELKM